MCRVVQSFRRDLEYLRSKLDGNFIRSVDENIEKLIQLEFNAASYVIMLEVLHGLKIIAEHLVKVCYAH